MKTTQELIELISLKKLEENLFEGKSSFMGSPNVFGGQVVSQALHAAYQTVPADRFCHSLHSYLEEVSVRVLLQQSKTVCLFL